MDASKIDQKPRIIKRLTGLVLPGNIKYSNTVKNVKAYITYYLNTSNLHGVKYIGEDGRYLLEKVSWFCVVVAVCSLCILSTMEAYVKWQRSPVIVSLKTKETPIFEIPFPAVTVCPEIKIDPKYFNITDYVTKKVKNNNVTKREDEQFEVTTLVCRGFSDWAFFGIEVSKSFIDSKMLHEVLDNVPSPFLEEIAAIFCGKSVDKLSFTLTQEGACYTFNMLNLGNILNHAEHFLKSKSNPDRDVNHWSLEEGYSPESTLNSYPKRTFISGNEGGLHLYLSINESEIDYICEGALEGFKVVVHHPCELPNMDKYFMLPPNQLVQVAIKPKMIAVSKDLNNYKPIDRHCYFVNEKSLFLYKIYTQQNCLDECFANYTLEHCGCVPFWLQYPNSTICGPSKNDCIKRSKVIYIRYSNSSKSNQCGCLPSCTSLSYDTEMSYTDWNWRELFEHYESIGLGDSAHLKTQRLSRLTVYYKDLQFLTSERHELYGTIDFFSNVGGLLGLSIGFSVVSVVELVYILTLRIVCNVKKYGREYWSGQPRFVNNQ